MSLAAYPAEVAADATAVVIFTGTPNRTVSWALTGSGGLVAGSTTTDGSGSAYALYTPGTVDDVVTVTVTYGI